MTFVDRPLPEALEIAPIVSRKPKCGRQEGHGRAKGATNKFTRDIKGAVLQAAANVGDEDYGGRGLIGYCEDLARNHKRAFAALLGKMIPLQLHADVASTSISNVRVFSVPQGCFLSAADIERMHAGSAPFQHVSELQPSPPERFDQPARLEEPAIEQALLEPPAPPESPLPGGTPLQRVQRLRREFDEADEAR